MIWGIRTLAATTAAASILGLVGVATATADSQMVATVPTSDGTLHLLPPLNNGSTGDPAQADSTLLDSVDVQYCKVTTNGCTSVGEANSVLPGVDLLALTGSVYTTAFSGAAHGVNNGDTLRITVRAAGLSLGSTQLAAKILGLPSSTQFNPLVPLTVQFRVDRNAAIRTRYLHDHNQTATQVAKVLKSEFTLDDLTASSVLYNDVRTGDVTPPGTAYSLQNLVDAVSAQSTYADDPTGTARTVAGKFDNQDVVNALVATPNLPNMDSAQLFSAMRDGLGVTDAGQELHLFENICVPGKMCTASPDGPPCLPLLCMAPPKVVCDAVSAITSSTAQAAQDFRNAQLYPQPVTGAKFLSTATTAASPGCGFDLATTARLLDLIYFTDGSPGVNQAKNVASTLMNGFVPGGITPDNIVAALAKAPIARQGTETLSCVAAVGAVQGGGFPFFDANNPQNVLNALGDDQSSLDNWQQTGTGNGLDTLGNCLAKAGVKIAFPLLRVHVQFTEAGLPSTSAETRRTYAVGRVGWLPQVGGQVPTLGGVRGLPALKTLPVPNLSGSLNDLTTLPAAAFTGGCLWYSANLGDACSTAVGTAWSIPGYDTGKVWPSSECQAHGETCGGATFATAGGGTPGVGEFTMVVPALPGVLNFEGSTLVNPNLAGCSPSQPEVPALQAGALAASADIWKRAPNGGKDFLATGGWHITLDGKNEVHTPIKISEQTDSLCGRITSADPHLNANVDVTFLKSVTDVPGALGETTVAIPNAQGPDAAGNIADMSLAGSAISDLSGITGAGNLFSTLAQAGVPITSANALTTLMRTGFLP